MHCSGNFNYIQQSHINTAYWNEKISGGILFVNKIERIDRIPELFQLVRVNRSIKKIQIEKICIISEKIFNTIINYTPKPKCELTLPLYTLNWLQSLHFEKMQNITSLTLYPPGDLSANDIHLLKTFLDRFYSYNLSDLFELNLNEWVIPAFANRYFESYVSKGLKLTLINSNPDTTNPTKKSNEELLKAHFEVQHVPFNRDNLFEACAMLTRRNAAKLRNDVVRHMWINQTNYALFMDDKTSLSEYIESMVYGGELEIMAISTLLQRPIAVYDKDVGYVLNEGQLVTNITYPKGENYLQNPNTIFLYRQDKHHYQPLIKKDERPIEELLNSLKVNDDTQTDGIMVSEQMGSGQLGELLIRSNVSQETCLTLCNEHILAADPELFFNDTDLFITLTDPAPIRALCIALQENRGFVTALNLNNIVFPDHIWKVFLNRIKPIAGDFSSFTMNIMSLNQLKQFLAVWPLNSLSTLNLARADFIATTEEESNEWNNLLSRQSAPIGFREPEITSVDGYLCVDNHGGFLSSSGYEQIKHRTLSDCKFINTRFSEQGWDSLNWNRSTELQFFQCGLSPRMISSLAHAKNLKKVTIESNALLTQKEAYCQAIKAVAEKGNLTQFSLNHNLLTDQDILSIFPNGAPEGLRELNLENNCITEIGRSVFDQKFSGQKRSHREFGTQGRIIDLKNNPVFDPRIIMSDIC